MRLVDDARNRRRRYARGQTYFLQGGTRDGTAPAHHLLVPQPELIPKSAGRLVALFLVADGAGDLRNLARPRRRHDQHAALVGEHDVPGTHLNFAQADRLVQRNRLEVPKALDRREATTKDGKAQLADEIDVSSRTITDHTNDAA